jgi:hypothetical protein
MTIKFDREGMQQKGGNKIKMQNEYRKETVGSDKGMEGMILHKVSSFNDAGILNSIAD